VTSAMIYRYVPIVRTKAGEAEALGNLSAKAKSRIFPVINATAAIPVSFLGNMITKLNGIPVALDGSYNCSATGSTSAFISLFSGLGNGGVPTIPVISVGSDQSLFEGRFELY
jgi:hypothetical protein